MGMSDNDDSVIRTLIDSLTCLPGVGPRTASRMAYHLLMRHRQQGLQLAVDLKNAMEAVVHCKSCHNLASSELCGICLNKKRHTHELCIVELPSDVLAIEQSGVYRGQYFVLMGHLSPLDGIGPEQLGIEKLLSKFPGDIREVIFAINPTAEGEATRFYITEKLKCYDLILSELASGIPVGSDLSFMNTSTIGNALTKRRALEPLNGFKTKRAQ